MLLGHNIIPNIPESTRCIIHTSSKPEDAVSRKSKLLEITKILKINNDRFPLDHANARKSSCIMEESRGILPIMYILLSTDFPVNISTPWYATS